MNNVSTKTCVREFSSSSCLAKIAGILPPQKNETKTFPIFSVLFSSKAQLPGDLFLPSLFLNKTQKICLLNFSHNPSLIPT